MTDFSNNNLGVPEGSSATTANEAERLQGIATPLKNLVILVADDVFENRELIGTFLSMAGASVIEACDGHEVVKKAVAEPVDVVLMDLQMPGRDGHAATRLLRSMDFQKPIIALTGSCNDDEASRCMNSGFSGYLAKPVMPSHLVAAVRGALSQERHRARKAVALPVSTTTFMTSRLDEQTVLEPIYRSFISKLSAQCDDLRKAWDTGDWGRVEKITHRIKGTAGSCGFRAIMLSACAIEDELHGQRQVHEFERHFQALLEARSQAASLFPLS